MDGSVRRGDSQGFCDKYMRKCNPFWWDSRGASMVEFGLTLPLFAALLFGAVEAGLLLWTQLGLQHAVATAARCATVSTTTCGTESAIQNVAVNSAYGLDPPPATFSFVSASCGNEVTANYSYHFITGRIAYTGASVALTARSCFPK